MAKLLDTNYLAIVKDEFIPRLNGGYYYNSGYNNEGDRYFEMLTMNKSGETGNGGSLLLEAFFGDFGDQSYCAFQVSTRGELRMSGIKNGVFTYTSDIVITKDDNGIYHLYLKQIANKWCADYILVKKYSTGLVTKINKYLPAPTANYEGSIVWQYSTDTKLMRVDPEYYEGLKTTESDITNLFGGGFLKRLFHRLRGGLLYAR